MVANYCVFSCHAGYLCPIVSWSCVAAFTWSSKERGKHVWTWWKEKLLNDSKENHSKVLGFNGHVVSVQKLPNQHVIGISHHETNWKVGRIEKSKHVPDWNKSTSDNLFGYLFAAWVQRIVVPHFLHAPMETSSLYGACVLSSWFETDKPWPIGFMSWYALGYAGWSHSLYFQLPL